MVKQGKNVTKHDIVRELKGINEKLHFVYNHLNSVNAGLVDYIDFNGQEKKFKKYLEKKYDNK